MEVLRKTWMDKLPETCGLCEIKSCHKIDIDIVRSKDCPLVCRPEKEDAMEIIEKWVERESGDFDVLAEMLGYGKKEIVIVKDCEFPKYVWMQRSALVLSSVEGDKAVYYRDAGVWSVKVKMQDGKVVSCGNKYPLDHTNGMELVGCTREEWAEDNAGYVMEKEETDDERNDRIKDMDDIAF